METQTVRVWDPAVRIFHWSLVIGFSIAWLTGEDEGQLHIYSGYAVLGLVLFRILWGFIGSRYARFSDFLYPPGKVMSYLRSLRTPTPEHYTGHNPAGGWMILALLTSLLLTSVSGLKIYGVEGHGPLASLPSVTATIISPAAADSGEHESENGEREENSAEEFWEEIHEWFSNLTLLLVALHITGVIVSGRLHGENLVKAMLTGNKQLH